MAGVLASASGCVRIVGGMNGTRREGDFVGWGKPDLFVWFVGSQRLVVFLHVARGIVRRDIQDGIRGQMVWIVLAILCLLSGLIEVLMELGDDVCVGTREPSGD